MPRHNGLRLARICSLLDALEEVMRRVEGLTKIGVRIVRNCALIGLVLGVPTGTGTLHQVAEFFG